MIPAPPPTLIPSPTSDRSSVRINAALIADAYRSFAPGSLVLARSDNAWEITAIGTPEQISDQIGSNQLPQPTQTHDLPDRVVIPALINAHTHLDLTHIGPYPHDPDKGFVPWLDMIRANRLMDDDAITDSVNLGITKSLAGGTIAVGDIAGAPKAILKDAPIYALARSPMLGTSYLEFFGIGTTATSVIDLLETYLQNHLPDLQQLLQHDDRRCGVRFGLSPHATNTISIAVYQWAAKIARQRHIPLCTHLAETLEEREFISKGTGTQRGFLERFGIWDDSILKEIGQGLHPIEHLLPVLDQTPVLCAHVNDAPGDTIEQLATTNTSVAYCPRAHTYFGHYDTLGEHPFEAMIQAGINVTLGTDSIVNLDTPDRITTLDDMRLLSNRNGTSMSTLLAMTTINPARALGLDESCYTLALKSKPAGIIAIPCDPGDPGAWSGAMRSTAAPEWLLFNAKIDASKGD